MDQIVTREDKGNISSAVDAELATLAYEIRKVGKRAVGEIGEHLIKAKALAGYGNWLPWLKREFGWSERTARNYMAVAERSRSATIADLNIDATAFLQLTAPSTPAEVVAEIVKDSALGKKITVKVVTKAKAAHKAAHAPAASKSNSNSETASTPATPASAEVLGGKMYDAYAGDKKHRPLPKIAAAFNVEPSVAREALIALGDCVVSRTTKGQREFKIMRDSEADMLSAIATKDRTIAELEARNAELEAQIDRYTAPAVTTAPAMVH